MQEKSYCRNLRSLDKRKPGRYSGPMSNFLLTIAMFGVTALAAGGFWLIVKGAQRRKGVLMLMAALVLLGNVLIWAVPL